MIPEKKYSVIIVAGGKGVRAGGDIPKQFQLLGEKPMLMYTIQAFYDYDYRVKIILVLPDGFDGYWKGLCEKHQFNVPHKIIMGGATRFQSVKNGLVEVSDDEIVAVHDGARPFVTSQLIARCFDIAFTKQCGVVPVIDEVNSVRFVTQRGSTIADRQSLKIVQTPQVFPASALKKAYETDFDSSFTDDASVAEKDGVKIELLSGEETNIKITTPFDLFIGKQYLHLMTNR
ncbi:MAG: 2-C-methyl-D-erythritol 4-phosphate cytidylyltransferase [Dysgonamonadaceae bacterium]|jgi:2-C-methyl-D-erythritol 4-phosphate cytidylyltransferase|nr:2-C-methyl-D-erythritol 4-phosphate cytidylyltransferase [Dysgonamonadaceae bacterium]